MTTKKHPPGPKGLPFIGMAHVFFRDVMEYIKMLPPYGDVVQVPVAGHKMIYMLHPDHIQYVLIKNRDNFVKGKFFERTKLIFGDGLVTSEGELWKAQRKKMAPAFQHRHVDTFAEPIAETVSTLFESYPSEGHISVESEMMAVTLEIALQILFGTHAGQDVEVVGRAFSQMSEFFASASETFLPLPIWLPTPANRGFQRSFNELEGVVTRIIEERKGASEQRSDLLGLLLQDEEGHGVMEDLQLRDEIRTLLLAGHETTALGLTYAAWFLSGEPERQEKMAAEINAITGGGPVRGEHFEALTSVEQVFKEAMRLYPPAPITMRESVNEDEIGGYHIPAGANIVIPMLLMHRDPRWFDEPEVFKPERWTPAFEKSLPRFAYFPFGGGPRVCIGSRMAMLEGVLVLAELIRRFQLTRTQDKLPKLMPSITLRLMKPLMMQITAR
tara:strand:+ start:7116 stop:8444 length:1329 start_codon:yes stop_codon:yes gene_type:complete